MLIEVLIVIMCLIGYITIANMVSTFLMEFFFSDREEEHITFLSVSIPLWLIAFVYGVLWPVFVPVVVIAVISIFTKE